MVGARAALVVVAAAAAGLAAISGGSGADPRTPPALAGMPPPFLGTAVVGSGGLAAAIDAYGDVVEMRAPGPAGASLIDNPADRQAAGSVPPDTGIVPSVAIGSAERPMWEADSVKQRYLSGTNVVRTVARFSLGPSRSGKVRFTIADAARGAELARSVRVDGPRGVELIPRLSLDVEGSEGLSCEGERRERELALICSVADQDRRRSVLARAALLIDNAARDDRRWLGRARPLGGGAPPWAERMYRRSLLVLRALIDRRTGAVAAGLRDGWAYVWPRDAAATAIALATSGYPRDARRIARFLLGLDLGGGARFSGDGAPVPGRAAQGDAAGWAVAAAKAAGLLPTGASELAIAWRDRSDYQEGAPGDFLGNAIAAADGPIAPLQEAQGPAHRTPGARSAAQRPPGEGQSARRRGDLGVARMFARPQGLVRRANDPASGLDSAAAWAVRPFSLPALFPLVRQTLRRLSANQTRFGIVPGEGWPGADPWTAPTAWTAWSLAVLGERRRALRLLTDLRRASTPAGALPERVDAGTGIPRSTTPLAWSHAFAILALRQLWPTP